MLRELHSNDSMECVGSCFIPLPELQEMTRDTRYPASYHFGYLIQHVVFGLGGGKSIVPRLVGSLQYQ